MTQRSRLTTVSTGVAGEYFVAAELARRGYVASLTLKNTQGIDILASNPDGSRQVAIQVKTEQGDGKEWVVSQKAESVDGESVFYVFVRLHGLGSPEYFVVPSGVVAEKVRTDHAHWLKTPGKRGQAHRDNPMRKFSDAAGKYKDAWQLLGLDHTRPNARS